LTGSSAANVTDGKHNISKMLRHLVPGDFFNNESNELLINPVRIDKDFLVNNTVISKALTEKNDSKIIVQISKIQKVKAAI
jgi:hypothetical protein